jgi:hypothetical protein
VLEADGDVRGVRGPKKLCISPPAFPFFDSYKTVAALRLCVHSQPTLNACLSPFCPFNYLGIVKGIVKLLFLAYSTWCDTV